MEIYYFDVFIQIFHFEVFDTLEIWKHKIVV